MALGNNLPVVFDKFKRKKLIMWNLYSTLQNAKCQVLVQCQPATVWHIGRYINFNNFKIWNLYPPLSLSEYDHIFSIFIELSFNWKFFRFFFKYINIINTFIYLLIWHRHFKFCILLLFYWNENNWLKWFCNKNNSIVYDRIKKMWNFKEFNQIHLFLYIFFVILF